MVREKHPNVGTPRQAKGPYVKTPPRAAQRGPHPSSPTGKEVKKAIKHLPREDWVAQNPSGMVFIDLDDDWIFSLENLLAEYGYEIPPYFYQPQPVGAHITLVTAEEAKKKGLVGREVEVGKKVKFTVSKCHVSFPRNRSYGLEARFKIKVKGKGLERIRKQMLGRVVPRGGFYIVVGVRRLKKRN